MIPDNKEKPVPAMADITTDMHRSGSLPLRRAVRAASLQFGIRRAEAQRDLIGKVHILAKRTQISWLKITQVTEIKEVSKVTLNSV